MARINVREIQSPIRQRYKDEPQSAQVKLKVRSAQADLGDPLHCAVLPVATPDVSWMSGAHPAVGGAGDVPCSGDLLLGALAACQETTIRMVAANMGIELESLELEIEADWFPRTSKASGPIACCGAPRNIASCSTRCGTAFRSNRPSRSGS